MVQWAQKLGYGALLVCCAAPAFAQSDNSLDALNQTIVSAYTAGRYAAGLPLAASAVELAERLNGRTIRKSPLLSTTMGGFSASPIILRKLRQLIDAH